MKDVIYVFVLLAFFALTGLFVVGCDKIIGPDEEALAEEPDFVASADALAGETAS